MKATPEQIEEYSRMAIERGGSVEMSNAIQYALDQVEHASGAAATSPRTAKRSKAPLASPLCVAFDGVFRAIIPVQTTTEVNGRDWRKRSKRTDAAWKAVSESLGPHLALLAPFAEAYHSGQALRVVFTRLGGRKVDASNLPTTTKAAEDALAFVMGADDGSPLWRAQWQQEPGGDAGVGVRIEIERTA